MESPPIERSMSGHEWRLHSHEEGRGAGTPWGWPHPLGAATPPPIYRGVGAPSPHTLEPLSLLPLLHLLASAWQSHGQIVFSTIHTVVLLEIPVDLLLPLPRWIEGTEVIVEPYV